MIPSEEAKRFLEEAQKAKTVFITAHVGPDGDTLGSMLGIKHAFAAHFNHIERIDCVISGRMPDVFYFLPGIDEVIDAESQPELLLEQYDLAFSVDCGAVDRLGPAATYFKGAKQSINIDHHYSNEKFGRINLIDLKAAASGQVVADLLMENGIPIPPDSAMCLYVALMTDTGGFKYSNTDVAVFDMAAHLTRCGANPEQAYRHVYEERPKCQVMLHADVARNAQFNADETLGWASVNRDMLERNGALDEHLEGAVEMLRQIKTVLIAAILRETQGGVTKISLRSDTELINVAEIAQKWGGGGHKMASGATMPFPLDEAERQLIPTLEAAIRSIRPVIETR